MSQIFSQEIAQSTDRLHSDYNTFCDAIAVRVHMWVCDRLHCMEDEHSEHISFTKNLKHCKLLRVIIIKRIDEHSPH